MCSPLQDPENLLVGKKESVSRSYCTCSPAPAQVHVTTHAPTSPLPKKTRFSKKVHYPQKPGLVVSVGLGT